MLFPLHPISSKPFYAISPSVYKGELLSLTCLSGFHARTLLLSFSIFWDVADSQHAPVLPDDVTGVLLILSLCIHYDWRLSHSLTFFVQGIAHTSLSPSLCFTCGVQTFECSIIRITCFLKAYDVYFYSTKGMLFPLLSPGFRRCCYTKARSAISVTRQAKTIACTSYRSFS